jgi:hypothetical protein
MVTGISSEELARLFPRLYHMAQNGSWASIHRHGLLSTSALLDLFEINGRQRQSIEAQHRPESISIQHEVHGSAVIRDQKPMSDSGLVRALQDGISPEQWYRSLNSRVFFWLTDERLKRLMEAKAYRTQRHTVLTVDTHRLLTRHSASVSLSPINSGCTKPFPRPRGNDTFLRMTEYPFASWRTKRPLRDSIVELAVDFGVPDVSDVVIEVKESGGALPDHLIWQRG